MSTNLLYEDGYENVIDENGGPEPTDYIIDQRKFITSTTATHAEYLKAALSNESSLTCPMLENPKDEDIPIKKASTKLDYVLYCPG
ncbi:hypothetical protein G6F46_003514 [Rhizopus delemar]|uniref:Uncharacterized protein n=3 Tax=Rhizopus TaxID=4842 RepID=I1CA03_RHIO9|nr:hypothetical protein RO3G_09993 [Rhizopus delemar RA 99-880]KAG1185204.1 hypothetical protein G6F36_007112 [Rhizopus arrhizus]KAG1466622.1 hypothetical protein G6F55_000372 [Rhizopus delemar]KAG1500402.1 hypothetical protein G6F54_003747 [Rhizopus delemar]KAG1514074.1 hypothetical protein G6F53_003948 [Rhizopus delemar]|eukprot:EIE85283.1 hypothetical protein RO3G_09993 [Rhizopus delemar RA 99-880]